MSQIQGIRRLALARTLAESDLKQLYSKALAWRDAGDNIVWVSRRFAKPMRAAMALLAKTSLKELIARLFTMPREVRDLIYDYLWGFDLFKGSMISSAFPLSDPVSTALQSCSRSSTTPRGCICHKNVPICLNVKLIGKRAALEAIDAFHRKARERLSYGCYHADWTQAASLSSPQCLHLDINLHTLLKGCQLQVCFDCLDNRKPEWGLDSIGIPGGTRGQLARCATALCQLAEQGPRRITFKFVDTTEGTPSDFKHVFSTLAAPLHQLRSHGFDVRVVYDTNSDTRYGNLGRWDLGSDGWEVQRSNVFAWTLYDWKMNFTRANSTFVPTYYADGTGTHPCPNGPVDLPGKDLRDKVEVYEDLRRYLFRTRPEVEQSVGFREENTVGAFGSVFVDCRCPLGRHTCSAYHLCFEHGGWDGDEEEGLNTYCYECRGIKPLAIGKLRANS
ncbi:hypothetical protein ACN47E_002756 [Coniothyrium glycines]